MIIYVPLGVAIGAICLAILTYIMYLILNHITSWEYEEQRTNNKGRAIDLETSGQLFHSGFQGRTAGSGIRDIRINEREVAQDGTSRSLGQHI